MLPTLNRVLFSISVIYLIKSHQVIFAVIAVHLCHAGRAKTTAPLQSCPFRAQLCYHPCSLFLRPRVYRRTDTTTVTMETPLAGTSGGENGVHFPKIHTCTETDWQRKKNILLLRDKKTTTLLIYSQPDHKKIIIGR